MTCKDCKHGLFRPFEFGIETPYGCTARPYEHRTRASFEKERSCGQFEPREGKSDEKIL